MEKLNNWYGNEENTSVEYDYSGQSNEAQILSEYARESVIPNHPLDGIIKADSTDCLVAASCGFLTGMLDAFWVGEFSLDQAQNWGRNKANSFVIKVSQLRGYSKDDLQGAIRFLEKDAPMASDKLTSTWGGGLQHHFRDFAHHASIVGLVFSILTQFTGMSYGTNVDGEFEIHPLPQEAVLGHTFEEKIYNGTVMWAIHLISDMAGSSSSAGKGTGIPGPVLSLFKEASVLPGVRSLSVDYKGDKIALSVWLSKLYNGTAFPHESYHDVKRLDLRTELGIYAFSVKQSIPVALNQCLIRAFYFIRHLCIEISRCKIQKLTDIRKLDPLKFLPQNNACVARMSTISTGVFSLVDISDAAIHSFLNTPENKGEFIANMLLRINFAGIAKFVVSVKKDISLSISANVKATDTTSTAAVGALTIDLEVRMENKEIYEYRFAELLNKVKHSRAHISKFAGRRNSESGPLFEIGTADYRTYNEIISHCESWTMYTIDRIITNIFEQNGIAFEPYRKAGKPVINFVRTENGKRIGYIFLFSHLRKGLLKVDEELKSYKDIDHVRIFFVVSKHTPGSGYDYIQGLNDLEKEEFGNYIEFGTLQDFFDETFDPDEYPMLKSYIDSFNERARTLIGYKTVITPTDEAISQFKDQKAEMLKRFDYQKFIPHTLFESQRDTLFRNYIDRGLYKAMIGESAFADSFISSEWYYCIYSAVGALDQTGIVAGYLKSVEQLLYAVIGLKKNMGMTIRTSEKEIVEYTSDSEDELGNTLGALQAFVQHNGKALEVSSFVKRHIVDTIDEWRDKQRNGYFHKDNLHDIDKVNEIREKAIYLYFLILGSWDIADTEFEKLGINHYELPVDECADPENLYLRFAEWVKPVLQLDIPKSASTVVFSIVAFVDRPIEILLQAEGEFVNSKGKLVNGQLFSTSYLNNNFEIRSSGAWDDVENTILSMIDRVISDERIDFNKMRSFPEIKVVNMLDVLKHYRKGKDY